MANHAGWSINDAWIFHVVYLSFSSSRVNFFPELT